MQATYTHVVRYVEVDGDVVVLPDEFDLQPQEAQIQLLESEIADHEAKLNQMESAPPTDETEKAKAERSKAIKDLRQGIYALQYRAKECRAGLVATKALVKQYWDSAAKIVFTMHRYSWNEEARIRSDAQEIGPMGPVLDEPKYVLDLLDSCIDSWDYEKPKTREEIAALPKPIVNCVFNRLVARSEPSPARLEFLRARGSRHTERQSAKS